MRKVTILLALFLLMVSTTVFAEEGIDFTYELVNEGTEVQITGYQGSERALVIPSEIVGLPVTEIGQMAFYRSGLLSVVLPDTLKIVGIGAFDANQLREVTFPASVEEIHGWSFSDNQIHQMDFLGSPVIDPYAFWYNQPVSSELIMYGDVDSSVKAFAEEEDYTFKALGTEKTVRTLGVDDNGFGYMLFNDNAEAQITTYAALTLNIIIPTEVEGVPVTKIASFAFEGVGITECIIPEGIDTISVKAFADNDLEIVAIPASVELIAYNAFSDNKISNVTIYGEPEFTSNAFSGNKADPADLTLLGGAGTSVETYAEDNGHSFQAIEIPLDIHEHYGLSIDFQTNQGYPGDIQIDGTYIRKNNDDYVVTVLYSGGELVTNVDGGTGIALTSFFNPPSGDLIKISWLNNVERISSGSGYVQYTVDAEDLAQVETITIFLYDLIYGDDNDNNMSVYLSVSDMKFDLVPEVEVLEFSNKSLFEALLSAGADVDGDGFISLVEAQETTTLDLSDKGLKSILGLEQFANLQTLSLEGNPLYNSETHWSEHHESLDFTIDGQVYEIWTLDVVEAGVVHGQYGLSVEFSEDDGYKGDVEVVGTYIKKLDDAYVVTVLYSEGILDSIEYEGVEITQTSFFNPPNGDVIAINWFENTERISSGTAYVQYVVEDEKLEQVEGVTVFLYDSSIDEAGEKRTYIYVSAENMNLTLVPVEETEAVETDTTSTKSSSNSGGGSSYIPVMPIAEEAYEVRENGQKKTAVFSSEVINNRVSVELNLSEMLLMESVAFENDLAEITLPKELFEEFGDIELEISKVTELSEALAAVVGDAPVFDFSIRRLSESDKQVHNFSSALTVSVPYELKEGDNPKYLTAFYLNDDGSVENMAGVYKDGNIVFETDHFSKYFVKSNNVTFSDTTNEKVLELASKGIIEGKGEANFDPEGTLTRAELATLLVRALNLELSYDEEVGFVDVDENQWYYDYIMTAKANGLVEGVGNELFDPLAEVKSQDAMIMISRIMTEFKKSEKLASELELNGISDYAVDYVSHLIALTFVSNDFEDGIMAISRLEMAELVYAMYFFE